MSVRRCLTNTTLRSVLDGATSAEIEDHFACCSRCRQNLERLAGAGEVLPIAQVAASDFDPDYSGGHAVSLFLQTLRDEDKLATSSNHAVVLTNSSGKNHRLKRVAISLSFVSLGVAIGLLFPLLFQPLSEHSATQSPNAATSTTAIDSDDAELEFIVQLAGNNQRIVCSTLQQAVDAANDRAVIQLPAAPLFISQPILIHDKRLTIQGFGADTSILQSLDTDASWDGLLNTNRDLTISSLQFRGGVLAHTSNRFSLQECQVFSSTSDALIHTSPVNVHVSHCRIDCPRGKFLAGIADSSSELRVTASTVNAICTAQFKSVDKASSKDEQAAAIELKDCIFSVNQMFQINFGSPSADVASVDCMFEVDSEANTFIWNRSVLDMTQLPVALQGGSSATGMDRYDWIRGAVNWKTSQDQWLPHPKNSSASYFRINGRPGPAWLPQDTESWQKFWQPPVNLER